MVNIKKTRESTKKKINSALPQNTTDNSDKNYKSTIITPIDQKRANDQERAIEVENNISNLDIAIQENKLIKEKRSEILLTIVNNFLINMNKTTITSLLAFTDIDRDDILIEANKDTLINMEEEIFKNFNKDKYMIYKNKPKKFVLNFLKSACIESGHNLCYKKKEIQEIFNNKKYRRTVFLYSIE